MSDPSEEEISLHPEGEEECLFDEADTKTVNELHLDVEDGELTSDIDELGMGCSGNTESAKSDLEEGEIVSEGDEIDDDGPVRLTRQTGGVKFSLVVPFIPLSVWQKERGLEAWMSERHVCRQPMNVRRIKEAVATCISEPDGHTESSKCIMKVLMVRDNNLRITSDNAGNHRGIALKEDLVRIFDDPQSNNYGKRGYNGKCVKRDGIGALVRNRGHTEHRRVGGLYMV